jgi:hypothetical protein
VKKILVVFLALLSLAFIRTTSVYAAASCGTAQVTADAGGNNVTECISSSSQADINNVNQVTATCRFSALKILGLPSSNCECHVDGWIGTAACENVAHRYLATQTQSVTPTVGTDAKGNYYTCFTLSGLDKNLGQLEISIKDASGNTICSPPGLVDVTPGDYSWLDYFTAMAKDAGICKYGACAVGVTSANMCDVIPTGTQEHTDCVGCVQPSDTTAKPGAWTAIGCIPTDVTGLVKILLSFGMGIAGGIAFLLILLGGFQIMTSAGNPEQLEAGKELVTSAITGLLLIIFSTFILRLIGVNILGIPQFK